MRQRVLLLTDDRRVREMWLPVVDGLLVDHKGYQAWDVEEAHVVPYGEDGADVVLLYAHSAVPLDPATLQPKKIADAKLRAVGLTSLYEGILDVAYRSKEKAMDGLNAVLLGLLGLLVILMGIGLWTGGTFEKLLG